MPFETPWEIWWDHNAWYHRRMLEALPDRLDDVLDVGCGAGTLAGRLSERARHVEAVDRSPHMVALARALVPANVTVTEADVTTMPLPPGHYDAITSVSVFHHLDLAVVLPRLAATLRPGGLLVAVALPRTDLPRDLPVEAVSAVGHRVLGTAFRVEQAVTGRRRRYAHEASVGVMPMQDPVLTTAQVRTIALAALPGVRVRRLPLWRYELRWRKPG